MADAAPPFSTSILSISFWLMLSMLPPGMPFITYSGPKPALRDETPRNCTLGDEFGSAPEVLVMLSPATLPCNDINGLFEATGSKSFDDTWVMALDTSRLSSVP